ncbi:Transposase IS200 like [Algoriphagus faecimaris]|uniref:Transposase IS200 like n=1 Tax=Algoriphagus faecimaris TaxID=686796 RepID=A0A1G6Q5P0_9BACT|nr:transposase [Algoriphagus faecimaris]SDC87056.1 Transposase IS200 like [Algoriphagus faecimaris]
MSASSYIFEEGRIFHIYSRSVGNELLFIEERNYQFFLEKYDHFCSGVFATFAYCLIPNHFHFLVRVKNPIQNQKVVKAFSDFLNSYTKAFNKTYSRNGALFQRKFKRKVVNEESYLTRLILYIHHNPAKHGFTDNFRSWKYSSYDTFLSQKSTKIERSFVLEWFGGLEFFRKEHESIKSEYLPDALLLE